MKVCPECELINPDGGELCDCGYSFLYGTQVDGATYRVDLQHEGLKKHRVIKGAEEETVLLKARLQKEDWDEKWQQAQVREEERRTKEEEKRQQGANKDLAAERSAEAQRKLELLDGTLRHTLTVDNTIIWEQLKDESRFTEPQPAKTQTPPRPKARTKPTEPNSEDPEYQPQLGLLDKLLTFRRLRIITDCQERFEEDHVRWRREVEVIETENAAADKNHDVHVRKLADEHRAAVRRWKERRSAFFEKQHRNNEMVAKHHADYMAGLAEATAQYCDMVLSASCYPDYFPQNFSLDYNPETKILIVEYALPAPEGLPTLREVRFVQSRSEFVEKHLSQREKSKMYDGLLYKITLRTVHELLEADTIRAIDAVVFNGIVTSVDRSTGEDVTACVLSLQAKRDEFTALNLANVEPKACFKKLKGVGSSKLHGLAPVPPLMQIQRDDDRFVTGKEVAEALDESSNLAAMDWQEFEHLIREVFEKEFSSAGGEVKVTQASRDGGVDAIGYDPDPIKGGKFVIQAKRYINTVGVSAVRDLYGTVMNEGANKGILVTTSDYGPDAYGFAKDKPLTLISGANLLHMLEKHGYR